MDEDLKPALRQKAAALLGRLGPTEREGLLVKNWMSHDARWFMAVARECGLPVANRLNQIAAREVGKVEAQRLLRALDLRPPATVDDYLLVQEAFIGLLGPDLLDYRVRKAGADAFRVEVQRCFAHDQAVRAEIADTYQCGIFARITGWLDTLGLAYDLSPPLGQCLKCQGQECAYTITLKKKEG